MGRLVAAFKKYVPRPMVYFPKSVIINNPWLAFLYWGLLAAFITLAAIMFFSTRQHDEFKAVTGEVSVLPWMSARRLADVEASVAKDQSSPFCSDPNRYVYESSSVPYGNITCARLCKRASRGTACVHPRELSMLEGPSAVFVPTFFSNEILSPATGPVDAGHYFVPGAEDSVVAFRHRLTVPEKTGNFNFFIAKWLLSPFESPQHSAISTESGGDTPTRIKTVFLDKDGSVKRTFEPGEVVSLTVSEILQSAIVDEFIDTVSKLSLDDHYVRIEEDILADRVHGRNRGPTARLTGTKITVNLEYTDTKRCALDPNSPLAHDFPRFEGYVACMSIKAARSWTTLDRASIVDVDGTQTSRRYHGLRVVFRLHGEFSFFDAIKIWEWITIFLIWSQIPTVIVYFFVITLLGNLSEVYRHVIHMNMNMLETVTGLVARLLCHSSSFLELKDSSQGGITQNTLLDRFLGIFRHSEELDDEEIKKFGDFVFKGMVKDSVPSDSESPGMRTISVQAYCDACCVNEFLKINQLVEIFDVDRKLGPFEFLFNDPNIASLRRDAKLTASEEARRLTDNTSPRLEWQDCNSHLEKALSTREAVSERLDRVVEDLRTTLEEWAQELRMLDKGGLYAMKRQELDRKGPPEARPATVCDNGATYTGQWVDDCRHGEGREAKEGLVYEGQWAANVQHGVGVLHMPQGAKYDGQWFNGKYHGVGFEVSSEGAKYEGQYVQGSKQGQGLFLLPDGATYTGEVLQNRLHGQGVYQWSDGHTYDGQWVDGKMHGEGAYTYANGNKYVGQFNHNLKDGHGVFTWPDGRCYEGEFANNDQNGQGCFRSPDGSTIQGTWAFGKQHGPATVTSSSGKRQTTRWEYGKRIHQASAFHSRGMNSSFALEREMARASVMSYARSFSREPSSLPRSSTNSRSIGRASSVHRGASAAARPSVSAAGRSSVGVAGRISLEAQDTDGQPGAG